jgi:tetratricopeptide (TPR) repeat protein
MKYILAFCFSMLVAIPCHAQSGTHKPSQKAKQLMDNATAKYMRSHGDPDSLADVARMVDAAIKADSLYLEAWSNKVALLCQSARHEQAIKELKKMQRLFPRDFEPMFNCGILEYKTNRTNDAIATFNKLLKQLNTDLEKYKNKPEYKAILINKGIVLILLDQAGEGKRLLNKLYNEEPDMYTKSYIAFYINSTKQAIIDDRIPGQ